MTLRIGCGGGFWGDSAEGPGQLVRDGNIDVLVIDYLAEITMALLARLRQRQPDAGYVPDFVAQIRALAPEIARQGIRVVVNAGGINPLGCRDAVVAALAEVGTELRVAVVLGDDLLNRAADVRAAGAELPSCLLSLNAYLGAFPIAAALESGAQIVITGRCVDSALALGPLIQHFGWRADDYDMLAAGSLAGHVIECGTQATGGLATDWQSVPGWDDVGFPIARCEADGSFVLTKPPGTGGRVGCDTVGEQIVYEIGDPASYILPDVVCDWRGVRVAQDGPDRVRVTGARGLPPTGRCKLCGTYADGFRAGGTMMIGGRDATAKARRTADAILARTRRLLRAHGLPDFRRVSVEVLGAEDSYGPYATAGDTREVVLKVAVHTGDREAAEMFSREFLPSATSMAPGITGFAAGRPKVAPLIRMATCLADAQAVSAHVVVDGNRIVVPAHAPAPPASPAKPDTRPTPAGPTDDEWAERGPAMTTVPLIALAYGRSGDKGDDANIGILARRPEFLPAIRAALTEAAVATCFGHLLTGGVDRYEVPGLHGLNFVLHGALDGGGTASLRHDAQGKAFAQMLMDFPVPIPAAWRAPGGPLAL
jgi:hypothetical protein